MVCLVLRYPLDALWPAGCVAKREALIRCHCSGIRLEAQVDDCQCQGLEAESQKWALKTLVRYRKGKPAKTTPMLIKAIVDLGVNGLSLLDIGGGIGIVQIELLRAGATDATSVEASSASLQVAQAEAARAALNHRIKYVHGDFVSLESVIPEADIVTLDRVICCYEDVHALVSLSASKARKLYALVYPRSTWWVNTLPAFLTNSHSSLYSVRVSFTLLP